MMGGTLFFRSRLYITYEEIARCLADLYVGGRENRVAGPALQYVGDFMQSDFLAKNVLAMMYQSLVLIISIDVR